MDKGVFPGKGTLTHSAHTVTPHKSDSESLWHSAIIHSRKKKICRKFSTGSNLLNKEMLALNDEILCSPSSCTDWTVTSGSQYRGASVEELLSRHYSRCPYLDPRSPKLMVDRQTQQRTPPSTSVSRTSRWRDLGSSASKVAPRQRHLDTDSLKSRSTDEGRVHNTGWRQEKQPYPTKLHLKGCENSRWKSSWN